MPDTAKNGPRVPSPFDRPALDRIIDATDLPLCVDLKTLQELLDEVYRHWVLMNYFGPRAARKSAERLAQAKRWAAEGERLLRDDVHLTLLDPSMLPHIKLFAARLGEVSPEYKNLPGSPLSILTGVYFPAVFKDCFKRKPGISRNTGTGKAGGPYVRFAQRACVAFGFECSAETIASALREHRVKPKPK